MHCNLTRAPIGRLLFHLSLGAVVFLIGHNQPLTAQTLSKTSSVTQLSREWNRYTIRDREFSVLLPMAPAMTTYEVRDDPLSKSRLIHIIGTYAEGVVYAIYIYTRKEPLEDFIARSTSGSFKRDLNVSSARGKEYIFEDDARKEIRQFFASGELIYVFHAYGSRLGNPDVGIPRFFESIRFERLSGGLAIVDGPGDPPSINTTAGDGSEARVLTGKEVTHKSGVVTKPEPTYTDDARKNEITGTVVLRCIFTSAGTVTDIRVVSGLPHGLTERAIEAARQIKFTPATRNGRFVSMYIQLEYNFNLY